MSKTSTFPTITRILDVRDTRDRIEVDDRVPGYLCLDRGNFVPVIAAVASMRFMSTSSCPMVRGPTLVRDVRGVSRWRCRCGSRVL